MRLAPALVLLALPACDDAPNQPLESPTPSLAAPAKAPEKLEAVERKTDAPKADRPAPKDFVGLLTAAKEPALVGPFAGLELSPTLSVPQAKRVAPQLFTTERPKEIAGPFVYATPEYPGIAFEVDRLGQIDTGPDTWLVDELRAQVPVTGVNSKLTAAWGEPTTRRSVDTWLAPAKHLRVDFVYEAGMHSPLATLVFRGYTPLAELIGDDPKLFGFEGGKPILGATGEEIRRRFGRRVMDYSSVRMWPTEVGDDVVLRFGFMVDEDELADLVIRGYTMELAEGEKVHALLEVKLGKPRPDRRNEHVMVYRKAPRVTFDGTELVVGEPPEW